MDMLDKEDDLAHDKSPSGPPTLSWSVLDFGAVLKGSQKTIQQVITNTTRQPMIWLADTGEARWLSVEPDHGVLLPGEQRSLRITANTASLAIGKHSVRVTFSSEGDTTSMCSDMAGIINVAESGLEVGLNFGGVLPQSTRRLGLHINNPLDCAIDWQIKTEGGKCTTLEHPEEDAEPAVATNWKPNVEADMDIIAKNGVILSKNRGKLGPHKSETIPVIANAANLEPGYHYSTKLTFTSQASGVEPKALPVPINFHVSGTCSYDGGPKPPCGVKVNINILAAQPSGKASFNILNEVPPNANLPVKWELTTDVPWVELSQSSGQVAAHKNQAIDVIVQKAALRPGTYTTDLHLTLDFFPTNGHTTECDIPVSVVVQ